MSLLAPPPARRHGDEIEVTDEATRDEAAALREDLKKAQTECDRLRSENKRLKKMLDAFSLRPATAFKDEGKNSRK